MEQTSMDNDLHIMERTEKLIAEMLRSLLASNDQPEGEGQQQVFDIDETVEYVILKDSEAKTKASLDNEMKKIRADFEKFAMTLNQPCESQNMDNIEMNELEEHIANGLNKIRMEYPMYAENPCANFYTDDHNTSVPMFGVCPLAGNTFGSCPYTWSNESMTARSDTSCSPMYTNENEMNRFYGENYWNNGQYDNNNSMSIEWPQPHTVLMDVTNNRNHETSNAIRENIENTGNVSDEENIENDENYYEEENENKASNTLSAATTVHCIMTRHDRRQIVCNKTMQAEISHYNVNSNLNGLSTSSGRIQICAASPTAIHAEQSTTTTTTTSGEFGVLHHQTSCTTTNFVPNNLANTVLTTNPSAFYAQSLLTSTAHQYLNLLRKEIQQYLTHHHNANSYGHNITASNWNLKLYERILYAQLLQQQILQQQQQQAAVASLLQQQKLALQNNGTNGNDGPAAITSYSNTNVTATSSSSSVSTTDDSATPSHAEVPSNKSKKSSNKGNEITDVNEKNIEVVGSLIPAGMIEHSGSLE